MTRWLKLLGALGVSALVMACGGGDPEPQQTAGLSLADAAKAQTELATLVAAVESAGMREQMASDEPLTFFAPSDAALADMREEIQAMMQPAQREALRDFVRGHLVPNAMVDAQMRAAIDSGSGMASLTTLAGTTLEISLREGALQVNGAQVQRSDVIARNGVIHIVGGPVWRPTVFTYVRALPQFSILESAIRAAGLTDVLSGRGKFTVFAPTNRAFEQLLAELKLSADQLLADKPLLSQVLTYHVLGERVYAQQLRDDTLVQTLQGQSLRVDVQGPRWFPRVTLTDAQGRASRVVLPNLGATNGVVHVVDRVVLPQTKNLVEVAQSKADFSILVEAVVAADLADALSGTGPFTVFAPTNAAFVGLLSELGLTKEQLLANKPLLTQVLTYHVLAGRLLSTGIVDGATPVTLQGQPIRLDTDGAVRITDARGRVASVVATDIQASNGVIHVIDKVVLPTDKTIVDLAIANPDFSVLVEAVVRADLAGALSAAGPFTVFAPTNAAFVDLLHELGLTKDQLLVNKPLLTQVLTYHVLNGRVLKAQVPAGVPIVTLEGSSFTVDSGLRITDEKGRRANIVATDVIASNGVIHVIDKVILPN
jgi:transforming growth factor-beta-induced protein